ncbi:MAG: ABC transporter permease, partial [bacterium]|nr:ABC transporter permease [bacterium]
MSELLTPTFALILLFSTIRLATPLIFAALGGLFSERAGVINIALEGLMLAGAFTAAVITYETSNPYLGFVAGMAAGALVALIFAIAVIQFEADQVVTGFAISMLMLGLPAVISSRLYDASGATQQIDKAYLLPNVSNDLPWTAVLAFVLVPISWYVLYKTPFGLRLRAVGENPAAADSAGV